MIILIFKIIRLKRKKKKKTQNQKAPKFDPKLLISSYPHIDEFPDFEPTKPKKPEKLNWNWNTVVYIVSHHPYVAISLFARH